MIGVAIVLQLTGFRWVDPIVGLGIGLLVLPRTWKLGRKAVRILMQEAPPEIGLEALRGALRGIDGVDEVHDLHVWTLTSGTEVCRAYRVLERDFGIDHCTVQVEPTSFSHGSPKGDEHA